MEYLGVIIALVFVVIVARLLLKKYNPHVILLVCGSLMLCISYFLNYKLPVLKEEISFIGFDFFRYIKESFSKTNAGVGLMIMAIGSFVTYIDKIGASKALVYVAMKPLRLFKKKPYIAVSMAIPVGQILFISIPFAAALSLLLMVSSFPILVNLGVSRLLAVSVITATTAFGMGPASAITVSASVLCDIPIIDYLVDYQIPLVWPLSILMMVTYYFVNKYFDKKIKKEKVTETEGCKKFDVLGIYALIPILPIILLIVFSKLFNLFSSPMILDTPTAMFISVFIALIFEAIRRRNIILHISRLILI